MAARWYVVMAHANLEKKVAEGIREAAQRRGLDDLFEEIIVPVETTTEVRRGKAVEAERKLFPGYVLVRMDLIDQTWALVRNVPKVIGFLENHGRPSPLGEAEAARMLGRLKEAAEAPKAPRRVLHEVGQTVRVTDGPFASFNGTVEAVDGEKGRLTVAVSIFGRPTNVELEFTQVTKA